MESTWRKTWTALGTQFAEFGSDVWHELFSGHKGVGPPYLLVCCQLGLGPGALGCSECSSHAPVWAIFVAETCPLGGYPKSSSRKWI